MEKRRILFVEQDDDVRGLVADHLTANGADKFELCCVRSLAEASGELEAGRFDGVLIDGLGDSGEAILVFVGRARTTAPELSVIVLIGYADMILDGDLKDSLRKERVSIIDKLEALKPENILALCEAACGRGYGEEL